MISFYYRLTTNDTVNAFSSLGNHYGLKMKLKDNLLVFINHLNSLSSTDAFNNFDFEADIGDDDCVLLRCGRTWKSSDSSNRSLLERSPLLLLLPAVCLGW